MNRKWKEGKEGFLGELPMVRMAFRGREAPNDVIHQTRQDLLGRPYIQMSRSLFISPSRDVFVCTLYNVYRYSVYIVYIHKCIHFPGLFGNLPEVFWD